jgi:hypothetical protein
LLPLTGLLDLTLYQYYGVAAFLGWLCGNVYVQRSRRLPPAIRRRLVLVYLLGPPALLYLVRAMESLAAQAAAPLAPVYATGVFAVLFMVPVSLRGSFRGRGSGIRR